MGNLLTSLRGLCVSALLLLAASAHAILPESGWYWNANESGRGFNIEIQDNIIFMSAFVYRSDGSPVWYVASGAMTSDRFWTADVYETSRGQCLGCTYRSPGANRVGSATLNFTTERTASLTLLGTTISLVRQDWSGYGTNTPSALLGEWTIVAGDPVYPLYDGERITLYQLATSTSGPYAGGNRTGATDNLAVGIYSSGVFGVLLDSSSLYYRFYSFTMTTFNRVEGLFWIYEKTSSLSGPGTYFVATRTKSGALVRTGVGPGVLKASAEDVSAREALDRGAFAAASRSSGSAADATARDLARRLEAELEIATR